MFWLFSYSNFYQRVSVLFWLALFVCALSLLSWPSVVNGKPTTEGISVQVTVTDKAEFAEVVFEFSEPIESLTLAGNGYINPQTRLATTLSGQSIDNGVVTLAAPGSTVVVRVLPDLQEVNSVYPAMSKIEGLGSLIFAPAILPEMRIARLTGFDRSGRQIDFDPSLDSQGYLYVGIPGTVTPDYEFIVAQNARSDLAVEIENQIEALLRYYTARMERSAGLKPTILLTTSYDERPYNRGDVTENGVIFLRYRLLEQVDLSEDTKRLSAEFLAHEIFHLWQDRENVDPRAWWLHEGVAEFASALALDEIMPSIGHTNDRLIASYNNCASTVFYHEFRYLSARNQSRARYSCGMLVQWLSSLEMQNNLTGPDIWTLWRQLWPAGESYGMTITDFRALGEVSFPSALRQADSIFSGEGTTRWVSIFETVQAVEPVMEEPENQFQSRVMIARSLVLSACGEFWGAGERNGTELYVSVPPECETFNDGSAIIRIDGLDPMTQLAESFSRVRSACSGEDKVDLVISQDGMTREASVRCDVPVQLPAPIMGQDVDVDIFRIIN